jgi:hypothetical protein
MKKPVRFTLRLGDNLNNFLKSTAESEGVTEGEIIRRAISILVAYDQQMKIGRTHIGFATDPSKLDSELVGVLNAVQG